MPQFAEEENQTATVIRMASEEIRFPDIINKIPVPQILCYQCYIWATEVYNPTVKCNLEYSLVCQASA
jgi:hypothetical protein